eukprot:COSAG01_NODE_11743_length_1868_cov_8.443754_2_plen_206_part_00
MRTARWYMRCAQQAHGLPTYIACFLFPPSFASWPAHSYGRVLSSSQLTAASWLACAHPLPAAATLLTGISSSQPSATSAASSPSCQGTLGDPARSASCPHHRLPPTYILDLSSSLASSSRLTASRRLPLLRTPYIYHEASFEAWKPPRSAPSSQASSPTSICVSITCTIHRHEAGTVHHGQLPASILPIGIGRIDIGIAIIGIAI